MTFVFWAIFTIVCAKADATLINNGLTINHGQRFILRLSFAMMLCVFHPCDSFVCYVAFLAWCGSFFWLFFDLLLNKYRKLPLLYVGQTAKIDKVFHDYPITMIVIKIVLLVGFTALIMII